MFNNSTITILVPPSETVPGVAEAERRRFWDAAIAFAEAAETDSLTAFAHNCFLGAGATDSGSWRGECRAVPDGAYWRPAEDGESATPVWTIPCLVDGRAIDVIAVNPQTGTSRPMTGMAVTLPPHPAADFGFTFCRDPLRWLAMATAWPPPLCALVPGSPDADDKLLRGNLVVTSKE